MASYDVIIIGGGIMGSSLAYNLMRMDDRLKVLVACGAAAGVAATFNAPIAGVVFAVQGYFSDRYLEDKTVETDVFKAQDSFRFSQ